MNTAIGIIHFFADYIEKSLGIVYQEANYYQLETRLTEVAKQTGYETVERLYEHCRIGVPSAVRGPLLDLATNNETSFFRDSHIFKVIEELCVERLRCRSDWNCNIWSAACSFGQEIYSIAMTLNKIQQTFPNFRYSILATDIADRALERASAGIYSDLEVGRGLSQDSLNRYFVQRQSSPASEWEVKPELKKGITFRKQNLLDPFTALGSFDFIFCRNVLIYQSVQNKKAIVEKLINRLSQDGYFFMGAAESLIGINDQLSMVRRDKVTFYVNSSKVNRAS